MNYPILSNNNNNNNNKLYIMLKANEQYFQNSIFDFIIHIMDQLNFNKGDNTDY